MAFHAFERLGNSPQRMDRMATNHFMSIVWAQTPSVWVTPKSVVIDFRPWVGHPPEPSGPPQTMAFAGFRDVRSQSTSPASLPAKFVRDITRDSFMIPTDAAELTRQPAKKVDSPETPEGYSVISSVS